MNMKIGENTYSQIGNDKASGMDAGVYSFEDVKKTAVINMSDAVSFSKGNNKGLIKGETIEDIQAMASLTDVQLQKNSMTVMANSMSEKDFAKLREDGYDITDMEPDQIVTISDEIKAQMAKSGQIIAGYNDDLDIDTLKEITGSVVYAEKIKDSFNNNDVPMTKENIKDAANAIEQAVSFSEPDLYTKLYMAENHLEPTIENIYKASFSGAGKERQGAVAYYSDGSGYMGKAGNEAVDDEAVKKALENIGIDSDIENIQFSKELIENNIALSEKSFDVYKKLNELKFPMDEQAIADKVAMAIKQGKMGMQADLSETESLLDKAIRLVDELDNISDQAVVNVAEKGDKLNLRNLKAESERLVKVTTMQMNISTTGSTLSMSQAAVSASRMMAEVRLSMTVSSTYVLLKNNINVDTTDLRLLVDELKEAENRQFESVFGTEYNVDKQGLKYLFNETTEKAEAIRNMPLATVGVLSIRNEYTLNTVYEEGRRLEARYIAANERYETMSTEVRGDLGDSIKKAFAGIGEMLDDMGLEHNSLNEKAVRILGYNQMEINQESVENVKDELTKLNGVLDMMKPGRVLSLIRSGINPLEISMDRLMQELGRIDDDNEPKRFSKFLNELDSANAITDQERQGFIGIYRLIHQIEKNDTAALGTLINADAEINFKNLLTAVRTRNHAGMDITIDNENGGLEKLIQKGISISEQIEKAFVSPASQKIDYTSDYYAKENQDIRDISKVSEGTIKLMEEAGIKITTSNILSFDKTVNNKAGIFTEVKKLTDANKEADNGLDSIINNILESMTDKESMDEVYEKMISASKEIINEESLNQDALNHDNPLENLHNMSLMADMVRMAGEISKHQYYKIPVEIEGQYLDMNVLIKSGDKKGVSVSFESKVYGRVSATFSKDSDGIEGTIFTDSENAVRSIEAKKDSLLLAFKDSELPVVNINVLNSRKVSLNIFEVSSDNMNIDAENKSQGRDIENSKEAISTKAYYNVAKVFIKEMAVTN